MTKEELWKAILGEMELTLSKANFKTWFNNTYILSKEGPVVTVGVPNNFVKEWMENKFKKKILNSLAVLDTTIRDVAFQIGAVGISSDLQNKDYTYLINEKILEEKTPAEINKLTNLNKRYKFDSFVIGSNNELAYAASIAVSKNLGKMYNPLFIYGGVGLGKTHLLQAIGNEVLKKSPDLSILYIPSERLTADIVESIRNRTIEELKKRYSKIDVLMVDDIQFIAGKEKTQDIFFSTFNELYTKNKQIILSSDRPPKAIPALEERLKSRFEGGMTADIGIPDFETRLAILKYKTKEKGFEFDEEIFSFIASNIQKNVRELEGALNKIIAVSQIYNQIPDLKEIKKLLQTYLNTPYKKTTPQNIIKSVADFYGISLADLSKRSRKKEIVRPRQIAMYLLREEVKLSFPEIGNKIGGRDHSTVIHAYEKINKEEQENETVKQEITLIKERIYNSLDLMNNSV